MHLLRVVLSPKGYQKVLEIMGSDQALAADGGTPFSSGINAYTLGVFRQAKRHRAMDAAVWRSSPGVEYHRSHGEHGTITRLLP